MNGKCIYTYQRKKENDKISIDSAEEKCRVTGPRMLTDSNKFDFWELTLFL